MCNNGFVQIQRWKSPFKKLGPSSSALRDLCFMVVALSVCLSTYFSAAFGLDQHCLLRPICPNISVCKVTEADLDKNFLENFASFGGKILCMINGLKFLTLFHT